MKALASLLVLSVGACLNAWGDTILFETRGLQVRVEGVSAEVLSEMEAVVEEQVALTDDTAVTPPLADDLTFFLLLRYRELGYRDAVVNWDVVGGVALLRVNEGQRYSVGTITYVGNASLPEADLTPYLLRPTHERVGPSVKTTPFVIADLKDGSELVQRYYHAEGYLDAVVAPPVFSPQAESHTVDVLVKVREGQHYVFGTVVATGSLEGAEREVENQFKDVSGQPFNEVQVETLRKNIVGIYEQRGHYEPTVVAEVAPHRRGNVPVTFRIEPGPLYRIGDMAIAPNFSKGSQRIIRSSFKRAAGNIYSPSELEFLTRHSLDSAMFSRLEVDLVPNEDNTLTLDITGEEAPRTTLTASLGYDTFLGPFARAEARRVNVMDTGNSARIRGEYSLLSKSAAIKWLDPAFLESAHSLDTELGAQSFTIFDYERRTLSLRTTLKKRWNKYISTDVYAEGSLNDTLSDALTPEELGPAEYNLGILGARIMLDFRDSPLLPTRGWVSSFGLAQTSGDTSYLRSEAMFAYYQRISSKFRAAMGLRSTALHMTDGPENVPIDLRVFNGGPTSVRSFPEREMGPRSRSGNTPLGGLMSQTASVEISYEVRPNFELALFGDAGNLSETVVNPFSPPEGLRYAIGLGIRYKLPIGPLRLDYGFNPDRKQGEPFGAVHFTFGFAF